MGQREGDTPLLQPERSSCRIVSASTSTHARTYGTSAQIADGSWAVSARKSASCRRGTTAEAYRLSEADLLFGELLPAKPWAIEQEEFEERTRVGFQLERLTRKVGEVFQGNWRSPQREKRHRLDPDWDVSIRGSAVV
jgi:hypothetical protein